MLLGVSDTYAVFHLKENGRKFLIRKSHVVKGSSDPVFMWTNNAAWLHYTHRRIIITKEKIKVITAVWGSGTEFIQFLALGRTEK